MPRNSADASSRTSDRPDLADLVKRPERFPLGRISITPGASGLDALGIKRGLFRHSRGDWGVVSERDRAANEEALEHDDRVLSAYLDLRTSEKFWVITEGDRSLTTVLLPDEY